MLRYPSIIFIKRREIAGFERNALHSFLAGPESPAEVGETASLRIGALSVERCIPAALRELGTSPASVSCHSSADNAGGLQFVVVDKGSMVRPEDLKEEFSLIDPRDLGDYLDAESVGELQELPLPLLHGAFTELDPETLFVESFEIRRSLRQKGLATAFYANLEREARRRGFRFVSGYHAASTAMDFYLNRGRYLLSSVCDERQAEFQRIYDHGGGDDRYVYTIKFLNPPDVLQYVRPECLHQEATASDGV